MFKSTILSSRLRVYAISLAALSTLFVLAISTFTTNAMPSATLVCENVWRNGVSIRVNNASSWGGLDARIVSNPAPLPGDWYDPPLTFYSITQAATANTIYSQRNLAESTSYTFTLQLEDGTNVASVSCSTTGTGHNMSGVLTTHSVDGTVINANNVTNGTPHQVFEGSDIVLRYALTNTGDVPIDEPGLGLGDTLDPDQLVESYLLNFYYDENGVNGGFFDAMVGGDTNGNNIVDPGETWIFEKTYNNVDTSLHNATLNPATGGYSIDSTGTHFNPVVRMYYRDFYSVWTIDKIFASEIIQVVEYSPSIDVEKWVDPAVSDEAIGANVEDDEAGAYEALVGESLTWTYVVRNNGNEDLENISLTDSDLGTISCPQTTLVVGADMTCTASGTADYQAAGTYYSNEATVTATGVTSGDPTNDSDESFYETPVVPAIDVEKWVDPDITNEAIGQDIEDEGESAYEAKMGQDLQWKFRVRNTGNEDLENIAITDSVLGAITCPQTTLAVGASMLCTANGTAGYFAVGSEHGNNAVVTGDGVNSGQTVTDDDWSYYYVDILAEISIKKYVDDVNGVAQDADTISVVHQSGVDAQYTIIVGPANSNTEIFIGGQANNDATYAVTDDQCDSIPVYQSGDTDGDDILDLDEQWTYTCEIANVTAADFNFPAGDDVALENIATVSGNPVDAAGNDLGGEADLTDNDPAHVTVINPDITIEKYVVVDDGTSTYRYPADSPATAVGVVDGATATYEIHISNTGDVTLETITGAPVDGLCTTNVNYLGGDTNTDGFLDTDETWIYSCQITNVTDDIINTASICANPVMLGLVDENGNPVGAGNYGYVESMYTATGFVCSEDPAHVQVLRPSIDLKKYVVTDDGLVDAQTAGDKVYFEAGSTAEFEIHVTNDGNTYLQFDNTDFTLTCDNLLRIDDGDADSLDLLAPGEVWRYTCDSDEIEVLSECVALVDATPVDENGNVLGIGNVQADDPVNVEPTTDPDLLADTGVQVHIALIAGIGIFFVSLALGRMTVSNKVQLASASKVSFKKKAKVTEVAPEAVAAEAVIEQPAQITQEATTSFRAKKIRR